MGYLISALCIAYFFWVFISNADLKIDKIKSYLEKRDLKYVSHTKVRKSTFPKFDIGENLFTWFFFRKHQYEVIASGVKGETKNIYVVFYQTTTFFYKNRVFFDLPLK
ncbi:MAG: hypothetical protein JJ876_10285 [Muricauda sp.]|nr:hypothetical protein [Allomuricauda sp.]MBO6829934.1 hypothetical protein [Allomuricauda sp.]